MDQVNIEELQNRLTELSRQDITEIDPASLSELQDLHISKEQPVGERVLALIRQTGNPYAYLDNGMVVKISFSETGKSLQACMEEYLVSEILPNA